MLLLAKGRHFRKGDVKFIIGRNRQDNETLLSYAKQPGAKIFDCAGAPGPIGVTFDEINEEMKKFIAGAVAAYSDTDKSREVDVNIITNDNKKTIKIMPGDRNNLTDLR